MGLLKMAPGPNKLTRGQPIQGVHKSWFREPDPWTDARLAADIGALPYVRPDDVWVGVNPRAYRGFLESKSRNWKVSDRTLDRRGQEFSRVPTHDRPPRIFWFDRPLPDWIHNAISRVRLGGKSVPDSTLFVLRDADVFEDGKPRTLVTLWQIEKERAFFVSWVLEGRDLAPIPNP